MKFLASACEQYNLLRIKIGIKQKVSKSSIAQGADENFMVGATRPWRDGEIKLTLKINIEPLRRNGNLSRLKIKGKPKRRIDIYSLDLIKFTIQ